MNQLLLLLIPLVIALTAYILFNKKEVKMVTAERKVMARCSFCNRWDESIVFTVSWWFIWQKITVCQSCFSKMFHWFKSGN